MRCNNCGSTIHDSRDYRCVKRMICANFYNLYKYTFTSRYMFLATRYLTRTSNVKLYNEELEYNGEILHDISRLSWFLLHNSFHNSRVLILLSDYSKPIGHRNYIYINGREVTLFEPHGWANYDPRKEDLLSEYFTNMGYMYTPNYVSWPGLGPQTVADDNIGLCQSFTLYNIKRIITNRGIENPSSRRIKDFICDILARIYIEFGWDNSFLIYNMLPQIAKDLY